MFSNPLESFHETVAEAKADREQLDRLLTVSSPRGLLLLALLFFLLVSLSAWLAFGVFERNIVAKGILNESTLTISRSAQIVRMEVWLSSNVNSEVRVGMPVMIKPKTDQVGFEPIQGEIQSILSLNLSKDLNVADQAPLTAQRIAIAVKPDVDVTSQIDDELFVIIQLGKQSPLELIG